MSMSGPVEDGKIRNGSDFPSITRFTFIADRELVCHFPIPKQTDGPLVSIPQLIELKFIIVQRNSERRGYPISTLLETWR